MPVLERYREFQRSPGFEADQAQQQVAEQLAALEQQLITRQSCASDNSARASNDTPQGLYIWGSVGRGKTLLMDLFYEDLTTRRKLRMHFHRFMKRVHSDLFRLSGTRNPLQRVAQEIAAEADLLCFDEFFISDIADAMILGHLTTALFSHGVVLVATSNQHPDELYREGVQRDRFIPAIEQLKAHNRILHLDGDLDHRLRAQSHTQPCLFTLTDSENHELHRHFARLSNNAHPEPTTLSIEQRSIRCRGHHDGLAWFDFTVLCEGPRSQNDFICLARNFHTLLISDIPALGGGNQQQCIARGTEDVTSNPTGNRILFNDDRTRRFISLIDELYDHSVNLIATLETAPRHLYQGGHLAFEFRRTLSRLTEMQSDDYRQRPHRPE